MQREDEPLGPAASVAFILIASLEVTVGVAGNVLLLFVLFTSRLLGQANWHNIFIANLAVIDLVILGYWMPFFVLDLILGYNPVVNQTHCQANGFIVCLCTIVYILTVVSISLNRYLHVCHSRLYRRVFNRTTTTVCCLLLWVVGAAVSVPPFSQVESLGSYDYRKDVHVCTFTSDTYPRAVTATFMLLSTLATVFFNFAIFRFWRRAKLNLRRNHMAAPQQTCCPCSPRDSVSLHGTETEEADGCKKRMPDTQSDAPTASHTMDTESNTATASHTVDMFSSRTSTEDPEIRELGQENGKETNRSEQPFSPKVTHTFPASTTSTVQSKPQSHTAHSGNTLNGDNYRYCPQTGPVRETALTAACPLPTKTAAPTRAKKLGVRKSQTFRKQLARRRRKQESRERAFVRSLAVISLLVVLSFLPFGIARVFEKSHHLQAEVAIFLTLLFFVNYSVNWAVYGIMNRNFKQEYARLMRRTVVTCCRPTSKRTVSLNLSQAR